MTEGLFDLAPVTPLKAPRVKASGDGPVEYKIYRPKHPVQCTDCAQVAYEANRLGESAAQIRQARFTRVQGALKVYICAEHKNLRVADEQQAAQAS